MLLPRLPSSEADTHFLSFFPQHLLEQDSLGHVGSQLLHSQEVIPYEAWGQFYILNFYSYFRKNILFLFW